MIKQKTLKAIEVIALTFVEQFQNERLSEMGDIDGKLPGGLIGRFVFGSDDSGLTKYSVEVYWVEVGWEQAPEGGTQSVVQYRIEVSNSNHKKKIEYLLNTPSVMQFAE